MSSRILGADRALERHRAVAPGVEVGEITTHGLALSRPRRGFESRWGHQTFCLRFSARAFRPRPKVLVRSTPVLVEQAPVRRLSSFSIRGSKVLRSLLRPYTEMSLGSKVP